MTARNLLTKQSESAEDIVALGAKSALSFSVLQAFRNKELGLFRLNNDIALVVSSVELMESIFDWLEALTSKSVKAPSCPKYPTLSKYVQEVFANRAVQFSRMDYGIVLHCDSEDTAMNIFTWLDTMDCGDGQA